jgi:hypothetical protein
MLTVVACGDSASGNDAPQGGGGGTTQGGGGTDPQGGGGGGEPLEPSDATSPDECVYYGDGGADQHYCQVFTAELSEPIDDQGLTATATTSLGVVSADPDTPPHVALIGDPVEQVVIVAYAPGPNQTDHYDPEWVEVALERDGATIGTARFERLQYACRADSPDDWCWEAAPVTLEITP